jgi:hypothetical protein
VRGVIVYPPVQVTILQLLEEMPPTPTVYATTLACLSRCGFVGCRSTWQSVKDAVGSLVKAYLMARMSEQAEALPAAERRMLEVTPAVRHP